MSTNRFYMSVAFAVGLLAAAFAAPATAGPGFPESWRQNVAPQTRASTGRTREPIWRNRGLFTSTSRREPQRPRHWDAPRTPRRSSARPPRTRNADPHRDRRPRARSRRERRFDPAFLPAEVAYEGAEAPGTIVIDTNTRYLYLVEDGGRARRYGVGVGRPGFQWAGEHRVSRKAEWPEWRPPAEMRKRQPGLPTFMPGGPRNPLGARALYLGSTLYRIHGSNEPWTIGHAVSSGCIRMRNQDVKDLYARVDVGTKVVVR